MWDTIEAAIDWLKGTIDDYYNVKGQQLQDLYQQARANLQAAYATGDQDIYSEAQSNLSDIIQMISDYQSNKETLRPIAEAIVGYGLGFAPAVVAAIYAIGGAAVAIAAITAVYVFYQNYQLNRDKFDQVTKMVNQGQITPSQAIESGALTQSPGFLQNATSLLSSGTGLLLVGGFIFLVMRK